MFCTCLGAILINTFISSLCTLDSVRREDKSVSKLQHVDVDVVDRPDLVCGLRGVRVVHHGWRRGGTQLRVSQLCW